MKRCGFVITGVVFLVSCIPGLVLADVPSFITYSGRLTDGTAWGKSEIMALTFRIYDQTEGGDPLWEQSFPAVAVEDGHFSIMLGNGKNPVDNTDLNVTDIFAAHDQTWITACVGEGCLPEGEMSPRQAVGSVPYAVKAEQVARPEIVYGERRYSLGAVYRTSTLGKVTVGSFDNTGQTKGSISIPGVAKGYASAKRACELAVDSPTAHVCTQEEMAISASLSVGGPSYAWIVTGGWGMATASTHANDCDGFESDSDSTGTGPQRGVLWCGHRALHGLCSQAFPVCCCDHP
jgi:hypothetical protein